MHKQDATKISTAPRREAECTHIGCQKSDGKLSEKSNDKYKSFASLIPYLELMRLDRPHGFAYFYLPQLHGAVHAAIMLQTSSRELTWAALVLLIATVFVRGAVCTWNDVVDAPLDRQVSRTSQRAIARGAVKPSAAIAFTLLQAIVAAGILQLLGPSCTIYFLPAVAAALAYPYAKRTTRFPQLCCALTISWAVLIGESAMGVSVFSSVGTWTLRRRTANDKVFSSLALYAANVMWNLGSEIIYSYQDLKDDVKAGIGTIAVYFPGNTWGKCLLSAIAILELAMLCLSGILMDRGPGSAFFTVTGSVTTLVLGSKICWVNLHDPSSCGKWFARDAVLGGSAILSGLVAQLYADRH